ncbi:MAG: hypothetical protein ABIK43_03910, partial [candidate division WOR-3 bacterium]
SGDGDIWFSQWSGYGWTQPQLVDPVPGIDICPMLASDPRRASGNGTVWLVWTSDRDGSRSTYYAWRSNSCWSRAVRAVQSGGHNINPSLAVDWTGVAYGIWQNLTDGNWDIHCSQLVRTGVDEVGMRSFDLMSATTFCRGVLTVDAPGVLLDPSGRRVLDLTVGTNRLGGVRAGVHFVACRSGRGYGHGGVRKLVVRH